MRIVKDKSVKDKGKKGADRARACAGACAAARAVSRDSARAAKRAAPPKPARTPPLKASRPAPPRAPSPSKPQSVSSASRANAAPVMRLRTVFIGLCVLAVFMAGPLALVWKQSYINAVSLRLESKTEALRKLDGEITSLRLESGRLSLPDRIERIAASRGFEYPQSSRMVILDVAPPERQSGALPAAGFFSRVKSFILRAKG